MIDSTMAMNRCQKLRERMASIRQKFQLFEQELDRSLKTRDFYEPNDLRVMLTLLIGELEERLPLGRHYEKAKELFGDYYYGVEDVEAIFGEVFKNNPPPPIPFTLKELDRARGQSYHLALKVSHDSQGLPITIKNFQERYRKKPPGGMIRGPLDRLDTKYFYTTETPEIEWVLVSRPEVASKIERWPDHLLFAAKKLSRDVEPHQLPDDFTQALNACYEYYRLMPASSFLPDAARTLAGYLLPKAVDVFYFHWLDHRVKSVRGLENSAQLAHQIFQREACLTSSFDYNGSSPVVLDYHIPFTEVSSVNPREHRDICSVFQRNFSVAPND